MVDYKDKDFISTVSNIKLNCGKILGVIDRMPGITEKAHELETFIREAIQNVICDIDFIIEERCGEEPEDDSAKIGFGHPTAACGC